MWYLEIRENGTYIVRRSYKTIEDAIMMIGLKYSETEINEKDDIQIHIGFIAKK